jgi:hypothetical protein
MWVVVASGASSSSILCAKWRVLAITSLTDKRYLVVCVERVDDALFGLTVWADARNTAQHF